MGDSSKLTKNKNVLQGKNAAIFFLKFTKKHKINDFLPEKSRTSFGCFYTVGLVFDFFAFFAFTGEIFKNCALF